MAGKDKNFIEISMPEKFVCRLDPEACTMPDSDDDIIDSSGDVIRL